MNNFIFNANSIYKNNKIDTEEDTLSYTLFGEHQSVDNMGFPVLHDTNEARTFAKKISRKNGSNKYMIRLDSSGKMFNPVSIYGEEKQKTFLDRICRSNTKYKEVNRKVFDLYLKFLQTKNTSWLNNAEREAE